MVLGPFAWDGIVMTHVGHRFFSVLGLSFFLSLSGVRSAEDKPPTKEVVTTLVQQLNDSNTTRRDEAFRELIKFGPSALPLLPPEDELTSETQKKQLSRVLKALKLLQIQQELPPRPVTLEGEWLLDKALADLAKQSGVKVEDRRRNKAEKALKLDLKAVTFWQAIDAVAKSADVQVSLYQRDGLIAIVDGPHVALPVSYHGPFRITIQRKVLIDDPVAQSHQFIVTLEIAWEPRFRPYLLETTPKSVAVEDDAKHELPVAEDGGKSAVEGKLAASVELHLTAPPRSVARLGSLRGEFTVTGAGEMLTFTFDTLDQLRDDAKSREQKQKGVVVRLAKPTLTDDLWTVEAQLDYPRHGPKFESFQSWNGYNEMFLQRTSGDQHFPNTGGYSVESTGSNRAVIRYHFIDKRQEKLTRGSPVDWRVVYKTPGILLEVPVPFAFKDVSLP
jgi:hypothetical protein